MWKLPNGRVIKHPRQIKIGSVKYPASIFTSWPVEKLVAIGVWPFREVRFDKALYRSVGHNDETRPADLEVVRTHSLEPIPTEVLEQRANVEEARELRDMLVSNQRDFINFFTVIYQVGRTKGLWTKDDFTAIDPTIITRLLDMKAKLTRLEELEALQN